MVGTMWQQVARVGTERQLFNWKHKAESELLVESIFAHSMATHSGTFSVARLQLYINPLASDTNNFNCTSTLSLSGKY